MSDIENMMDEDLANIYNELKEIVIKNNSELKNIDALDVLDEDTINFIFVTFNLHPTKEFKEEMKNLFAISKFILLSSEQEKIIKKINTDLDILLDKSKISWSILEDFKNQITFTKNKEINDDSKPQSLLIKYRIDSESDEIIYSIAGSYWGYDITKSQLKMILENVNTIQSSYKPSDFSFNTTSNSLNIKVNGLDISIKKQ